jgi:hypothetical protein
MALDRDLEGDADVRLTDPFNIVEPSIGFVVKTKIAIITKGTYDSTPVRIAINIFVFSLAATPDLPRAMKINTTETTTRRIAAIVAMINGTLLLGFPMDLFLERPSPNGAMNPAATIPKTRVMSAISMEVLAGDVPNFVYAKPAITTMTSNKITKITMRTTRITAREFPLPSAISRRVLGWWIFWSRKISGQMRIPVGYGEHSII